MYLVGHRICCFVECIVVFQPLIRVTSAKVKRRTGYPDIEGALDIQVSVGVNVDRRSIASFDHVSKSTAGSAREGLVPLCQYHKPLGSRVFHVYALSFDGYVRCRCVALIITSASRLVSYPDSPYPRPRWWMRTSKPLVCRATQPLSGKPFSGCFLVERVPLCRVANAMAQLREFRKAL